MSLSDFIALPEDASPSPNSLIGGKKTKSVSQPSLPDLNDNDEEEDDDVCLFAPPSPAGVPTRTSAKAPRSDSLFRNSAPARLPRRFDSLRGTPPQGLLPRSSSFKNPNSCKKGLPRRSVSFDKVKIREFERVLGDNPPPSPGPSLALGWNYHEKKEVSIDKFEKHGINGKARRWSSARNLLTGNNKKDGDFHLTPEQRIKIAQNLGYTHGEIKKNIREGEKVRRQRDATEIEHDIFTGRRTV